MHEEGLQWFCPQFWGHSAHTARSEPSADSVETWKSGWSAHKQASWEASYIWCDEHIANSWLQNWNQNDRMLPVKILRKKWWPIWHQQPRTHTFHALHLIVWHVLSKLCTRSFETELGEIKFHVEQTSLFFAIKPVTVFKFRWSHVIKKGKSCIPHSDPANWNWALEAKHWWSPISVCKEATSHLIGHSSWRESPLDSSIVFYFQGLRGE